MRLWRARFAHKGLPGLWEVARGRGRKATYGPEKIQQVIDTTLRSKPKGQSQWSCRGLAHQLGVSKSTVSNIWRSHQLKPHRVKTFKLSRDPQQLEPPVVTRRAAWPYLSFTTSLMSVELMSAS